MVLHPENCANPISPPEEEPSTPNFFLLPTRSENLSTVILKLFLRPRTASRLLMDDPRAHIPHFLSQATHTYNALLATTRTPRKRSKEGQTRTLPAVWIHTSCDYPTAPSSALGDRPLPDHTGFQTKSRSPPLIRQSYRRRAWHLCQNGSPRLIQDQWIDRINVKSLALAVPCPLCKYKKGSGTQAWTEAVMPPRRMMLIQLYQSASALKSPSVSTHSDRNCCLAAPNRTQHPGLLIEPSIPGVPGTITTTCHRPC